MKDVKGWLYMLLSSMDGTVDLFSPIELPGPFEDFHPNGPKVITALPTAALHSSLVLTYTLEGCRVGGSVTAQPLSFPGGPQC